ncbi:MAG TPA: RICIN domain-containing protein, partial [Acidimicrobiales bacterium]|nr:RICIN domain-containing protein [Acidimicrobiales bacterium]
VAATVPVGSNPDAVAVDPSTHTAYVANENAGTVSVISYNPSYYPYYPSGYYQLAGDSSGLCVDVEDASTANNGVIDQWGCKTSGQANQEWQWNPVSGGYGELQNENSGKDLVVLGASTAAGAPIIQYTQNGTANGLWEPIALANGSWQFQNKNSGQCLDVPNISQSPGIQFDQSPCQANPLAYGNQAFATQ